MPGVSNMSKDTAGTKTLTSESRPHALFTHASSRRTEKKTADPPQVVLVGVEHRETPSL